MSEEIRGWITGRLPDDWFSGPVDATIDRDEVLVVGPLADVELEADATDAAKSAARAARITRFREETRQARMRIADEVEHRYGRKVSWGARIGDEQVLFTTVSAPVMTRLRQQDRIVLDTLVDAGVARSRSDALAWCVRLVGKNEREWIGSLRDALVKVEEVRSTGPSSTSKAS